MSVPWKSLYFPGHVFEGIFVGLEEVAILGKTRTLKVLQPTVEQCSRFDGGLLYGNNENCASVSLKSGLPDFKGPKRDKLYCTQLYWKSTWCFVNLKF